MPPLLAMYNKENPSVHWDLVENITEEKLLAEEAAGDAPSVAMLDTTNRVATTRKSGLSLQGIVHRPVVTDLAVALTDDLGALGDGERKPQLEGSRFCRAGWGSRPVRSHPGVFYFHAIRASHVLDNGLPGGSFVRTASLVATSLLAG